MTTYYSNLFKELLVAFYENVFELKVNQLISDESIDKEEFSKVISALCGVDITYSDNFAQNLEYAIKHYTETNTVVTKAGKCLKKCVTINGKTICQNSCPFDAIVINNEIPEIDRNLCTNCGLCVDACPGKTYIDKVEFLPILNLLKENNMVIAAVAPSIVGQFGSDVSLGQLRYALKQIGFADMVEVAFFADMLSLKEAVEFNRYVNKKEDFMLSSCCCPIWVGMIKNKFKDLIKYTSPSISPMIAAGRVIKKINPECKVVFIGPCIAKKAEAKAPDLKGDIDFVLDYVELKDIFDAYNIHPENLPEELSSQYASREGRMYGRIGGVSTSIEEVVKSMFEDKAELFTSCHASGVVECKDMLQKILNGNIEAHFIEGMGCKGGCVGGPKVLIPMEEGTKAINSFSDSSDIKLCLTSDIMKSFLEKIGINDVKDFKDESKIEIFERKF